MPSGADKDSRTEQPTAKKLLDSFKEGTFPHAQEVGVAFTLIAGLLILLFAGQYLAQSVFRVSVSIFGNLDSIYIDPNGMQYWAIQSMIALGRLSGPFLIASIIAAVVAGGIQTKFRLTPKVLGVKFNKLNPISGFKRVISKDVLIRFGIDLLKLAAVALIIYTAVLKIVRDPIFYTPVDVFHIARFIADTLIFVFIRLAAALAVIAIISYVYQNFKTKDDLKMTKEEVKQEKKDQDMSPQLRSARFKMAMQMAQQQMLSEVPTADVVVTNPTHYAVALKYERGIDAAPMVLAKGENAFAQRIKQIARDNGVPIVENKMVARMLHKVAQVGASIPVEMYQSVAEILAFVYRTHRYYFHKLKARRAARKRS